MRENRLITGLLLAVVLVVILNLPESVSGAFKGFVREAVAPLQDAVHRGWRSLGEAAASVRGFGSLARENQRLGSELAALRAEIRDLRALAAENEELRRELRFHARAPRQLIACEVLARDPDGWWQTLRLNKGRADGVLPNLAVVAAEGLIGRTVEVSEHTADVLLVSDPACKVAVRIPRTSTFGVLAGRGPSWRGETLCRIDFVNKNAAIRPGDEVVTSGLGGIFPKGLLVGYVGDQVFADRTGLYQQADVVSRARLGQLQYAYVVRGQPPANLMATPAPAGEAAP